MKPMDCAITIVLPKALEEDFVDHLLAHPDWVSGFVIGEHEGAGAGVALQGAREHVRGRSTRMQVQSVIAREDAQRLIASLKAAFPSPEVVYWLTPVIEFGRLG